MLLASENKERLLSFLVCFQRKETNLLVLCPMPGALDRECCFTDGRLCTDDDKPSGSDPKVISKSGERPFQEIRLDVVVIHEGMQRITHGITSKELMR